MKLLLDTQALIWTVEAPSRLGVAARRSLEDSSNDLLVSAATVWEIAIKFGLGKLRLSISYRQWMNQALSDLGGKLLPITVEYADMQAALPSHHKDPFDRLLIAQALVEQIPIVSIDPQFDPYGVNRIWS